jgi:general secretion pathway protein A
MIYNNFFGFSEEPFGVTPDPKFLYLSKRHEEALAHLNFGISENRGFVMLTGEVGSGKTTLIRHLLNTLSPKTHTSLIINPKVEPLELLKLITNDFGIVCTGSTYKDYLDALNNFLVESFSRNEKAVLIIDEAQELSPECLEFIRLLSNFETDTKKLLQVVLVGQPELEKSIGSKRLRQLDQRIAVRYHLEPLNFSETVKYIHHRLNVAGGGMVSFPKRGVKRIYKFSRGVPRLINIACDRVLLLSYSKGQMRITTGMVKTALRELSFKRIRILRPAIAFSFLAAIAIGIYSDSLRESNIEKEELSKSEPIKKPISEEKVPQDIQVKERFYLDAGSMIRASNIEDSKDASLLSLLRLWGETDITLSPVAEETITKKGFSTYLSKSDWNKLLKFNMPCILHMKIIPPHPPLVKGGRGDYQMKEVDKAKWVVLIWVIGEDAVIFDPLEGRKIVPIGLLRDSVVESIVLWEDKYNTSDKISKLQKELKIRGLFNKPVTGIFGPYTKEAVSRLQKKEGLPVTGKLDDETKIVLSRDSLTPELLPR